ncbi:hypothetical protein Bca4012_075834 [Brassica carinata]
MTPGPTSTTSTLTIAISEVEKEKIDLKAQHNTKREESFIASSSTILPSFSPNLSVSYQNSHHWLSNSRKVCKFFSKKVSEISAE